MTKQNEQKPENKRNIDRSPEANFRKALDIVNEGAAKIYKADSKDPKLTVVDEIRARLEELAK